MLFLHVILLSHNFLCSWKFPIMCYELVCSLLNFLHCFYVTNASFAFFLSLPFCSQKKRRSYIHESTMYAHSYMLLLVSLWLLIWLAFSHSQCMYTQYLLMTLYTPYSHIEYYDIFVDSDVITFSSFVVCLFFVCLISLFYWCPVGTVVTF